MRLAPLLLMLTGILISGCASRPVDCTMGAGHNGCAPGTKEYEQMVQLQQDAKSAAEIDDTVRNRDQWLMPSAAKRGLEIASCSSHPALSKPDQCRNNGV